MLRSPNDLEFSGESPPERSEEGWSSAAIPGWAASSTYVRGPRSLSIELAIPIREALASELGDCQRIGFRVDLGGCPPRPPTDPYVRNYRIRFLRLRFRYQLCYPLKSR
jgi:hypothetical protein